MSGGGETRPDPAGRDLRAAEYVLGTLDAGERAAFERERAVDPAAEAALRAWERRLAPLALAAPEIEPGAGIWQGIRDRIAREGTDGAGTEASGPDRATAANDNRLGDLRRQLRLWRFTAAGAGLVAAGLALLVLTGLPRREAGQGEGRYVAVVTSAGDLPALIVSVDTAAGTARVRPVAAQAPAGQSLELWYVGPGAAPKPLGLLDAAATRLRLPPEAGRGGEGVIAVSVEPPGGSPTGQPTGPVIYTGKLIRE
ncbi:anti-sigma factor [Methylorubrum zatmanii]|uniref:Anti-sigma factor domain-containing protein n=1 Tax=Methylorubrum zatmanii TaxID=29429 RepID=A0ABW1WPV4_9HYPH